MEMVKKVKKQDLKDLIWMHYLHTVRQIPLLETARQNSYIISVSVNSISINVYDTASFDSNDDQEACLDNFAKLIEALTFGNLKVVDRGCEVNGNSYLTYLHIANAYEVVD